MNDGRLFPWDAAIWKATEIKDKLAPHCERIEIAGSIRRGKKMVKDIDLVVIPKMTSKESLLGVTDDLAKTDFYEALPNALTAIKAEGTKLIRGTAQLALGPCIPVDIYVATAERWATLLLIRTGSREHNIWLCSRAFHCGGKLHADGSGLELAGQYDAVLQRTANMRVLRPESEEEIFKALGIPFAEPRDRECLNARPVWMRA
jgi:DNA polymerase (family 10)